MADLGTYCGVQQAIAVERFAALDFRRPLGSLRKQSDEVDDVCYRPYSARLVGACD